MGADAASDLTINRLRAEFAAAGKPGDYDALKDVCWPTGGRLIMRRVAKQLGVSEGAARVAVHRLRKRFREIYREEISQTLADGEDVEAEMRHLAAALARQ